MNKLYILCGIPFSGKTFLAKGIEKELGYSRIDLDDIKFELYGKDVEDKDLKQEDWDNVYQKVYRRVENLLRQGKTVIYDTGNFTKHERGPVKQIADRLDIETITIFVDTPKPVAYDRLLKNRETKDRFDVSSGSFENTVKEMEEPTPEENPLVFHYSDSIDAWISKNMKR